MDEETRQKFEAIEKEIIEIKKKIFLSTVVEKGETSIKEKEFKGLSGGINFIITEGFLKNLKSVDEIWNELKREGYVYPKTSVTKILNVDFVNKKKILVRLEENKVWKYAIRK